MSNHHLWPKGRYPNWRSARWNIIRLWKHRHELGWHELWGNRNLDEIICLMKTDAVKHGWLGKNRRYNEIGGLSWRMVWGDKDPIQVLRILLRVQRRQRARRANVPKKKPRLHMKDIRRRRGGK